MIKGLNWVGIKTERFSESVGTSDAEEGPSAENGFSGRVVLRRVG